MSVRITEKDYKNFGKCVFAENGLVSVGIMVDSGPRIIYFSLCGKENVMFEDTQRIFKEPAGEYGDWYAYGGHRLWCAPEINPETYYPDNSKTEYSVNADTITVKTAATPFGKVFELSVTMCGDKPEISITHKIHNVSGKPQTFAAWSITSTAAGGSCFVPVCTQRTGYLPNRVISLWDYSDINDKRFTLTNTSALIRQDSGAEKPFKAGFNVDDGFAACSVKGQLFVKCFPPYKKANYPDYCCNFETYTNKLFLEFELLGEEREFKSGETAEISESWCIFENDIDFGGDPEKVKSEILNKINSL